MTKSKCCNAATTVQGKTTHYYTCNECGNACDGEPCEPSNTKLLERYEKGRQLYEESRMEVVKLKKECKNYEEACNIYEKLIESMGSNRKIDYVIYLEWFVYGWLSCTALVIIIQLFICIYFTGA